VGGGAEVEAEMGAVHVGLWMRGTVVKRHRRSSARQKMLQQRSEEGLDTKSGSVAVGPLQQRRAMNTGYCVTYGGKRCQKAGCLTAARGGKQHCHAHGGGRRCMPAAGLLQGSCWRPHPALQGSWRR
jgi:hypothetical protein